jgi:hypothetical protein
MTTDDSKSGAPLSFGLGQQNKAEGSTAGTTSSSESIESPWVAASEGKLELLQQSLSQLNLTVSAADESGYSLLMAASSYRQMAVLEWLLTQPDLDVNAIDQDGDSALHYASHVDVAKFLLENAKVNSQIQNLEGMTALDAKRIELEELMQDDEDDDVDDDEAQMLRELIAYLESIPNLPQ